jgi:hypothetical protein
MFVIPQARALGTGNLPAGKANLLKVRSQICWYVFLKPLSLFEIWPKQFQH